MDEYNKVGKMSANTINYILIFLIIVGVSVFSFINGPTDTLVSIQDDAFTVTGINDAVLTINYEDITALEFLEPLPDFGEALEVEESGKTISGTYKNEIYGEYQAHLDTRIDACLMVRTEEFTVLFNVESAETTKELGEALDKYMNNIF